MSELNPRVPEEGAKVNPPDEILDSSPYVRVNDEGKKEPLEKIKRVAPAPKFRTWTGHLDSNFFQFNPQQPIWYYSDDFLYNTLDRLLAYDEENKVWKPLLLDDDGALIVTSQATITANVTIVDVDIPSQSTPLEVDGTVNIGNFPATQNVNVTNGAGASAVNIQDGGNSITVDATSWPLPTGAATEATLVSANAHLATIDTNIGNVTNVHNGSPNRFFVEGAVFDDSYAPASGSPRTLPLRIGNNGGLHSNLRNNSGTEIGITGSPLVISGTVTPSGTQNVNLSQVNGATVDVGNGAAGSGTQRVTIANDNSAVTVAQATAANLNATVVQATAANLNATVVQATAANLNAQVVGNIAHDSPDAGNPVKIGGFASTSAPTAVTVGDRVNAWYSTTGQAHAVIDGTVSVDIGKMIGTGANTAVSVTSASTAILASNANRLGFFLTNNGTQTVYIQYGATATVATSWPLLRGQSVNMVTPGAYSGAIAGIVASGTCDVRVVEFTA